MRWLAAILLIFAVPYTLQASEPLKGDAARGMTIAASCVQCHGWTRGPDFEGIPILASQQQVYLVNQLHKMQTSARLRLTPDRPEAREFDFLLGDFRANHSMATTIKDMSDQDVQDLAAFFSAMPCERPSSSAWVTPPPVVERCGSCHGRQGISELPSVPHLAGQDEMYLYLQLELFKDRTTKMSSKDDIGRHSKIMASQIGPASAQDIKTLARYYAGLPCHPQ